MKIRFFGLFAFISLFGMSLGFAHSGRTDANGGHHDRKNGGYHYHSGGPRSTPSQPASTTAPRSAIVSPITAPTAVPSPIHVSPQITAAPVALPSEAQKAETELKVIAWQKKQAAAGYASAQYDLGVRYLTGNGVEKDLDKAISLLESATKQNHSQAQKRLKIALLEKELLVTEKPTKAADIFDAVALETENEALRKENQALRRLLANEGSQSQQVPVTAAVAGPITAQNNPAVSPANSHSKDAGWSLSSTGKRHNNRCRYFGGKPCGQNDGVACKVCGG